MGTPITDKIAEICAFYINSEEYKKAKLEEDSVTLRSINRKFLKDFFDLTKHPDSNMSFEEFLDNFTIINEDSDITEHSESEKYPRNFKDIKVIGSYNTLEFPFLRRVIQTKMDIIRVEQESMDFKIGLIPKAKNHLQEPKGYQGGYRGHKRKRF